MSWIYLSIAIFAEIIATTALKKADGFSVLGPSIVTISGYAIAFYFLSLSLKSIPVGVAYAVWSGVGIVAISLLGLILFKQRLDTAGMIGMGFIVVGVLILNVFSKSSS